MKVQQIDKFFSVHNMDSDMPELNVLGYIGSDEKDVNYPAVKNAIRQMKAAGKSVCMLNINSGGGDVIEGLAIHDEMKASGIRFIPSVIGQAASMGAILAFSGDGLPYMSPNARLMLHKPETGIYGDSDSLRESADVVDTMEKDLRKIITSRTGKTDADLDPYFQRGSMKWFTTDEAVQAGLARRADAAAGVAPLQRPIPVENFTEGMTEKEAYGRVYNVVTNYLTNTTSDMKLNVTNRSNLKLGETPTEDEINTAITNQYTELVAAKDELKKFKEQRATEVKNRGKQLIQNAIDNKQILETERAQYEADYEANPELTERFINKLPKPTDIKNRINPDGGQGGGAGADDRSKWTVYDWQQKDFDGLHKMKVSNRAQYDKLYKDAGIEVVDEE